MSGMGIKTYPDGSWEEGMFKQGKAEGWLFKVTKDKFLCLLMTYLDILCQYFVLSIMPMGIVFKDIISKQG